MLVLRHGMTGSQPCTVFCNQRSGRCVLILQIARVSLRCVEGKKGNQPKVLQQGGHIVYRKYTHDCRKQEMVFEKLHAINLDMVPQLVYFQAVGIIYICVLLLGYGKERGVMQPAELKRREEQGVG